jgi:diguanylate cyclase (GGDEF)-like protein
MPNPGGVFCSLVWLKLAGRLVEVARTTTPKQLQPALSPCRQALPSMTLDPSQPISLVGFQMLLYAAMWGAAWLILPEERRALGHWLLFSLLLSAGLMLISQRPHGTPWLTEVLGNICAMAGFVAMRRGADLFMPLRSRDVEHLGLLIGVGGGLLLIGPAPDGMLARGLLIMSGMAWLFLRMAGELFQPMRAQFGPRVAWAAALPLLLFGAVNLLRLVLALRGQPSVMAVNQPGAVNYLLIYVGVFTAAVFNFLFLFLVVLRLVGRLTFQAQHDPLTGLLNRRAMQTLLEREWQRHQRLGEPFALVSVDIDHFKRINDRHGHGAGDAVLREVALLLRDAARGIDLVARMGGEEFLLLLPGTDTRSGQAAAQRLRQALVTREMLLTPGVTKVVTASFGVAAPLPGDPQVDVLLQRADAALYHAKRSGRNRVVTQDEVASSGTSGVATTLR